MKLIEIRKSGTSAIITLPKGCLKLMGCKVRDYLELKVNPNNSITLEKLGRKKDE